MQQAQVLFGLVACFQFVVASRVVVVDPNLKMKRAYRSSFEQ